MGDRKFGTDCERERENEGVNRELGVLSQRERDGDREKGYLIIYIVLLIWEKK